MGSKLFQNHLGFFKHVFHTIKTLSKFPHNYFRFSKLFQNFLSNQFQDPFNVPTQISKIRRQIQKTILKSMSTKREEVLKNLKNGHQQEIKQGLCSPQILRFGRNEDKIRLFSCPFFKSVRSRTKLFIRLSSISNGFRSARALLSLSLSK